MIKSVIKDEDIIRHLDSISDIATVGATSGSPWYWNLIPVPGLPYADSKSDREIGVLRYPDLTKPYFQVYKVVMKAARVDMSLPLLRIFSVSSNSVEVEFECHRFDVNQRVIDNISPVATKEATRYVDDLF